jgi:hypothetical protein
MDVALESREAYWSMRKLLEVTADSKKAESAIWPNPGD